MSKIILASQSPRRKELLAAMGVEFTAIPSDFDEYLDDARSPEEVAIELALGKAMVVAQQHPNDIVIGADTIVTVGGKQLAKAANDIEAENMLRLLAGTHNEVTTGLVVLKLSDTIQLKKAGTAVVYFRPYDETAVQTYIATSDYRDKAGAYGIQSGAAPLIEYFTGNYDTILGLPTSVLAELLNQLGLEAKPVELEPPVIQKLV